MAEIIYILTNEYMEGIIKIGRTSRAADIRSKELNRDNVPGLYEIHYACEVGNSEKEEKWLHDVFADRRTRDDREFFKMDPERAVAALKRVEKKDTTIESKESNPLSQEEEKKIEEGRTHKPHFKFEKYGIEVGEEIYYSRDETITAKVLGNNRIKFEGEETTISAAAEKLLGYRVAGTSHWKYGEETLNERRIRMDEENGLST